MEIQQVTDRFFAAFLLLFIFSSSSPFAIRPGEAFPFITSDVAEVSGLSFDYIVVGGGASGCPLAATLSERFSVLLVERGGLPFGNPIVSESRNFGFPLIQTDEFSSVAQSFVSEEGVMNHRGRVLGGSTAINAGFYSRASEDFIKKAGWNEEQVRVSYEWVESKVVFVPKLLTPRQSTIKDSLLQSGILPFNGFSLEHLEGTKVGGTIFDEFGRRHTSADILKFGDWSRLRVLVNATVKNVIFRDNADGSKPRACGIRLMRSNGSPDDTFEIYINQPLVDSESWGDIILSAGALGSPQILMLSGIGPQEHLKNFNITALINSRTVGKGIKDNPTVAHFVDVIARNPQADPPQVVGIAENFQIIVVGGNQITSSNTVRRILSAKLAFPRSEGELKLRDTDPRRNPSVRYNYLMRKEDLNMCVNMIQLIERVVQFESIKNFLGDDHYNKTRKPSAEGLRKFCKKNATTFYHYHGGCAVGSVVDKDYRVYGVGGLRVVDGSTLFDSPGTNPMATVLMLGRYQGMQILKGREHKDAAWKKNHHNHFLNNKGP